MTNPSPFDADVLALGAGPVGLTIANELARRGVSVRVVEKAPAIREISKALIWHVRTQEVLDKVGIIERGKAEAAPLREVVVRAYGKRIGAWHLDGLDSPHSHPVIIGQNRTQHLLLDLLRSRGGAVEWNTEATTLQMDADGATVTLRKTNPEDGSAREETVRARYVVGCEGSDSLVRKTLGLTFEGDKYSGEQFIQADCKLKWALPSGRSYLFLTNDGYLMAIEMPDGMTRIFISLPDAEGQQQAAPSQGATEDTSHEPTLDDIRDNLRRLTGIEAELSDPVWLARYRTSHRCANKFSEGRAFVAGDAGHVHVPIGGQGMNTGIQDAFNLGWKLAGVVKGAYKPEILETYNAERYPVAQGLIRGTDRAYKGILHPAELQQKAARMFGPYLMRLNPVQNAVRAMLEEINITYPDTPLNLDCGGSGGPKPGERILDAPTVRWSDKQTLSLHELTRFAEWTLLLFGGTPPRAAYANLAELAREIAEKYAPHITAHLVIAECAPPAALQFNGSILLDLEHYLHEKYGVATAALYLLRPDQCVGFRGGPEDADALRDYLRRLFATA